MHCERYDFPNSRRDFLQMAGCGFGAVALTSLEANANTRNRAAMDVDIDVLARRVVLIRDLRDGVFIGLFLEKVMSEIWWSW